MLRWQAGRCAAEIMEGADGWDVRVKRWELVAFASTSGELIDKLATLFPESQPRIKRF
jgi:hypothetical protein